jgi:uncharacterized membrane protein
MARANIAKAGPPGRFGDFGGLIVTRAGVYLYGLATLAAGVFDLGWGGFDADHQPIQAFGDHIPGVTILAYITGVWMIAGGAAILWRRTARAGGAALAVIYFVFTVFWLPRLYWAPHILGVRFSVYAGVLAGVGSQLIVAAAGALVFSSASASSSLRMHGSASLWPRTIVIARWIFGLCSIDFGLAHLTDIADNLIYVPKWMPLGAEFWVIVTGICFVLAGLAILSGVQDVLAAWLLGLMFLAFNAVALPQFIFADPKNHAAWGGYAYNLAAVAACWIFADSIASYRAEREDQAGARLGRRKGHQIMTRRRMLALLVVVAHWIVAVGHLFLAAKVLPAPNNSVSWLAITFITLGHLAISIALWKLSDKLAGLVSLIFFLSASGADLYEHFLHASANNVFMVARGDWTGRFDASVFVLLGLEIVGCLLGILLLGGRTRNDSQPKFAR